MTINDTVFGEIEYDFGWTRVIILDFFGKPTEIDLIIDGEEDGQFEEDQYLAYQSFIKNWHSLQHEILNSIKSYYLQKRKDLGFDTELKKEYPVVDSSKQILNMVSLDAVVVPYADIFEDRHIGITFNCTWDTENGLGIRLLNEKVTEVGYQDVAI
ncbi:DUF2004 domain-containing protein [Bacillus sp. P14.5]|uniref:DUF6985 domain-containing protein n=1 Tax=Bacillus sp. P14.5 TaxID=1983400 RepID=UPI000DEA3824|nr:DUF2004 domain-containing protein [Bacillus sp. P14.5]